MSQDIHKYEVLFNWIKNEIISGKLKYGDKIFSENELSSMFNVSRQTVRQAIGALEREGYVNRRKGSGTFIAYDGLKRRTASKNIGVISTYFDSYIFPKIISGIEGVLTQNGYGMLLSLTNNTIENEKRALLSMLENNVDGLIVEPTKSSLPNPNLNLYHQFAEQNKPIVFFNSYYPGQPYPYVAMDDYLAGKLATEHFISKGHKKIAGVFQSDNNQGHLRYSGYLSALDEAGIQVNSSNIIWLATEDIPYLKSGDRLLKRIADCTAVLCYNDQIAVKIIELLKKRSVIIPDNLSIIGIDDAEIASLVSLTTLSHPLDKLGEAAANNLIKLITYPGFNATTVFEPTLIERDSVKQVYTQD